ncbi:MAG: flagellar filament capping protein FliD [Gammaproteobacteria bacterium]|nr:flagellar filament capping protein FliD [Gammaproteobacteria bacterium]
MAITASTGIGSGIDINGLVSSIVNAERLPVQNRLDRREAELQTKLTAYGTLKGALSAFQGSLVSLKTLSTFDQRSSSSSDEDVATITANSTADIGSHSLTIKNLAKSHKLVTDSTLTNAQFTSETATLGTGTLTFRFGTTVHDAGGDTYTSFTQNPDKASVDVTVTDGSLKGVRDAINNANVGATASIIYDGSYYRLSIVSDDTGVDSSMEIRVSNDADNDDLDGAGLSLLNFYEAADTTEYTTLKQSEEALDAKFDLDGIANITSATNKITDVITGLTIELKAATGTTNLTVSRDTSYISSNINSFVAKYNALINTANELAKYDVDTGEAGTLNGDGVLRNIVSRIRSTISNPVEGLTDTRILAEIGISVSGTDGTLVLDNSKLDGVMSSDLNAVLSLFAEVGTPTDALIDFVSSTDDTQVGEYAINITQLATQGTYSGNAHVADLKIDSGVDDTLTLSIDGVATTITLTAQTYGSAAALAAEIQARINGAEEFSDAGVSAQVTADGSGVITITSNSYGSDSQVTISGGNGLTGIFGSSTTSTTGKDVAGTIGGYEAIGEGQYLTGTQATAGLQIKVSPDGATGDRGFINFTSGYAKQLDDYLAELLDSEGLFTTVTDGVQNSIDSIGTQREELNRRLIKIEERTRAQFIAMDAIVATLRSTSDFLTQQLASLPKITVRGSK